MGDKEGTIPPPLTEEALKKLILEAIDNATESDNPETFHALWGHPERGIQTDDVIHGLERDWEFERPPHFNKKHWQWKYYIETENIDGLPILVIIAVDSRAREFEVITRWIN